MKKDIVLWIFLGALGLWLGVENPLLHLPGLIILYPLALLILGYKSSEKSEALRYGWLLGLLGSSLALYWLAIPIHYVGGLPWILAFPCAIFVGTFFGFFCGLFSLASFCFRDVNIWEKTLLLALVWYITEWLRGWVFTGFPWFPFAIGFVRSPLLLQGASILGVYGLSGLYVGICCLGFEGIHYYKSACNKSQLQALFPLLVVCIMCVVIFVFGCFRLTPNSIPTENNGIVMAIVQGNDDQLIKWTNENKYQSIQGYIDLSEKLLAEIKKQQSVDQVRLPDIFLWPETVLPFDFQSQFEQEGRRRIHRFVNMYQIPLIFGAPGIEREGLDITIFNRAYYYAPDIQKIYQHRIENRELQWYDKEHLVPFGEYTPPLLNLPFLQQILQEIGVYTPGDKVHPFLFEYISCVSAKGKSQCIQRIIPIGMLVCYEAIFPELTRKRVAEGAEILVTLSNDAWFGKTVAQRQHLQLIQIRTIEVGRWMARSTVSGISAFIDPYGRIVAAAEPFVPTYLVGTVIPLHDNTVFFWIEPWLPSISIVFLCVLLWHTGIVNPFRIVKNRGFSCFS